MEKCPSCRHENMAGEDRCANCFHSLMQTGFMKAKRGDSYQNVMMDTPLSEFVKDHHDVLVTSAGDSLGKTIRVLASEKKSCVLVYDHKKIVGILSQRDILRKASGENKNLDDLRVRDVMTPKPDTLKADHVLAYAINMMAVGGCRHVPVLDKDGAPLAIVSIQDVLHYLAHLDE